MAGVIEESKGICDQKKIEYQELLKASLIHSTRKLLSFIVNRSHYKGFTRQYNLLCLLNSPGTGLVINL